MVLNKKIASQLTAASITLGLLAAPTAALAQETAPLSFVASPEVYKVIAEKGHYRVILGTWQPGQRDKWHSHPEKAVYFVTACKLRVFKPDGTHRDLNLPAGGAAITPAVGSHSAQNIGSKVCKIAHFEPM